MEWLNYHHLLYFYTVASEGTIAKASETLRLAQPTISGQLRVLEDRLGEKLFQRKGRRLVLTEVGHTVYRYAQEIFSVGRELQAALAGRAVERPMRLAAGISDVVPKLIAHRILEPALEAERPVQLLCLEGRTETLLAELASMELDLVLSDAPMPPGLPVKAFSHLLGTSTLSFYAAPALAKKLKRRFPQSLDGVPMLLPLANSVPRRALDTWFAGLGFAPRIAGEFQDSALMKVFGQAGAGVFAAPTAVEADVKARYAVMPLGEVAELTETYYAITPERRIKNPAVVQLREQARRTLFGHSA